MANEPLEIRVYPVSGWDTGPIDGGSGITWRIKYLDIETQQPAETPFLGIPGSEVGKLIDSLKHAVARLEATRNGG